MKKNLLNRFANAMMTKNTLKLIKGGYGGGCCTAECRDVHGQVLGFVSLDKTCANAFSSCEHFYPATWMSYCSC